IPYRLNLIFVESPVPAGLSLIPVSECSAAASSEQRILLRAFARGVAGAAVEGDDVLILFVGEIEDLHRSGRRQGSLHALRQCLGLLLAGTEAHVDRELRHLETLVEEE